MKRQNSPVLLVLVLLAVALLSVSCKGGTSATTMHLIKTEGTVSVSDGEGRDIVPVDNLGLYSGYQVGTQAESYAWINLDDVKLTKMDTDSQAEITKDGKKLEINMLSGSLFFNVTEPLDDDETMNIRISSMLVGIRGTCGWVETPDSGTMRVYLLEGRAECTAGETTAVVSAGEMAEMTAEGAIEVKTFDVLAVPDFVAVEMEADEDLNEVVREASGISIAGSLQRAYSDVFYRSVEEGKEIIFAEEIDFEADGSPELLVIFKSEGYFDANIYRKGTEKSEFLCNNGIFSLDGTGAMVNGRISLVESEGRPYVLCYSLVTQYINNSTESNENYYYMGSLAQNDGDRSYWGPVDRVWCHEWSGDPDYYSFKQDEKGLYSGMYIDSTAGEHEAVIQKYTEVRVLFEL